LRQIAEALEAAHSQEIVHRDLKPENIMLARTGSCTEIVKVIDFGVARIALPLEPNRLSTVMVGTLGYMALEQVLGRASAASDIYSLAVIAHEMLTGRHPLDGDDACGAAPEVMESIQRAMSIDPANRPKSARHFIEMLERALQRPQGVRRRAFR